MNSLQRSILLVALTCTTAAGIVITKQESVVARPCGSDIFSRIGCTLDPTNPRSNNGQETQRDWFAIYFKNSCDLPIQVAILHYFPANSGGGSGSDAGVALYTPAKWVSEGWWKIKPGERALVANQTLNQNLYYYAESIVGGRVWAGNDISTDLRGRNLSFKKVSMGEKFVDFTMELTCP
jgi:Protein of unknown function (DUF1036)